MNGKCRSCESTDVTIENCERICTNCGDVQEEFDNGSNEAIIDPGCLCMLPDNNTIEENHRNKKFEANQRLTARIRGETNNAETKRKISREKLMDDMRKLVKLLIKHASAVDETMDLINSTLNAYKGRLLTSKKLGLVGACIYYLSAKHQLGISLNDICKVMNIRLKVISVCLKQVKQLSPKFEYERPNLKDLVAKYINELAIKHYDANSMETNIIDNNSTSNTTSTTKTIPEFRPLIDSKDRIVLQNRVMLLIDLFEAMHPYNQPTPQSLITAVVYHAWRSLDTFKMIAINLSSNINNISHTNSRSNDDDYEEQQVNRKAIKVKHSISFEKFCNICNVKYSSNGYKIVSKLQSSLLMLGRHLGDVNKINLPWFLKDIIENSPHLIQEHMRNDLQQTINLKPKV